LSEIISCLCLADIEDEDYVPDCDDENSENERKDELYFRRHTDYHERFLVYDVAELTYNDDDDPDALHEIWWEKEIPHLQKRFRGGCLTGAYK